MINEIGEIQSLTLTKGNVDDRKPVPTITKRQTGLLFGDKGYIKKELFEKLFDRGLKLVTKVKKGMKNVLISLKEKILLRKRSIIETVFACLKNKFELTPQIANKFFGTYFFNINFIFHAVEKALYFYAFLCWLIHSWGYYFLSKIFYLRFEIGIF